ncbi:MAG: gluconate 2-dehydrogenase subunit 3 family protein [Dysgonamonadaceae bacterium]|jgi:gluconate 2-dehydrogenase gamma chain|nr:gluconate 2-dehydrogenase subunit 3 family protein [Dysgonamonadaceae bacterium]
MESCNRRKFIKTVGLLYGSLLVAPACTLLSKKSGYLSFTNEEANCLIALCEQLIPADEYPGATDAGVIHFIDRQSKRRFPNEQELFKNGVASLQAWCKATHNSLFEDLDASTQTAIMQSMEKDEIKSDEWIVSPKDFFNKLLARTMQGFYGSPRHGGNRDYVSFKMLRLDYPLLIGQNRYIKSEK